MSRYKALRNAVQRIIEADNNPVTLAHPMFRRDWQQVSEAVSTDLIQFSDWLVIHWEPGELRAFLERCNTAVGDKIRALTASQAADLWHDCLALAYYRLYMVLHETEQVHRKNIANGLEGLDQIWQEVQQPLSLLETLADGGTAQDGRYHIQGLNSTVPIQNVATDLPQQPSPDEPSAHAWRLDTSEIKAIVTRIEKWRTHQPGVALPDRAIWLLALVLMETNEEQAWHHVWGLVAPQQQQQGGMGQIRVSVLPPDEAMLRCELALWSRYRPGPDDLTSLHHVAHVLDDLLPDSPGARYRVAFNPPAVTPAGPAHLTESRTRGASLGLAVALAAYAASQEMDLWPLAATGEVKERYVVGVKSVSEKVRMLLTYNAKVEEWNSTHPELSSLPRIERLYVPQDNYAEAKAASAGQLNLNAGLREPIELRELQQLFDPGVLYDSLKQYCEWVEQHYSEEANALDLDSKDRELSRSLADQVLTYLQSSLFPGSPDQVQQRGHLLPVPYNDDPKQSVLMPTAAYLAVRLAQQRKEWAEKLGQAGKTVPPKPPAPVVIQVQEKDKSFESLVVDAVGQSYSILTPEQVHESWSSHQNEFAVILVDPDDRLKSQGFERLLWEIGGLDSTEGRHFVILVAKDIHQMLRWAKYLEQAKQILSPSVESWFRSGEPS